METNIINLTKIISYIQSLPKSSIFISVISQTEPKMKKTGNPYHGRIIKISKTVYNLNFDYTKAVERIREKSTGEENEYIAQAVYFETSEYCRAIVQHKKDTSKLYLYGRVVGKPQSKYFEILENGKYRPINKKLIEPFLPVKKEYIQGEEKPVVNTVSIDNILRLKYGNRTLSV